MQNLEKQSWQQGKPQKQFPNPIKIHLYFVHFVSSIYKVPLIDIQTLHYQMVVNFM